MLWMRDNVFWEYCEVLRWNITKHLHSLPCGFDVLPTWVKVGFLVPLMLSWARWLASANDIFTHMTWAETLDVHARLVLATCISVLARKRHTPGHHWSQHEETNVIDLNLTHSLESVPVGPSRAITIDRPVNMSNKQMLMVESHGLFSCSLCKNYESRNLTDTNIQHI